MIFFNLLNKRGLKLGLAALAVCAACYPAHAAEMLDNVKLVKALKSGVALEVVEKMIQSNLGNCSFDASTEAIIEIQTAGTEGKWKPEEIKTLQNRVIEIANLDQKRQKELVLKALNIFENADESEYSSVMRSLLKENKSIVIYLLQNLEQESDRKRVGVLDALSRIGDNGKAVQKAVLLSLFDRAKPVRAQAAKTVAALATQDTATEVEALLNNRQEKMDGVAMALGFIGNAKSEAALAKLLKKSNDQDARMCAAFALGEMRAKEPASVDILLEAVLDQDDERVRDASSRALGLIGDKRAPAYIMRSYDRFRQGRENIIQNLRYFKDIKAAEFLAELTSEDDPKVKTAAVETLSLMTGERFDDSAGWKASLEYIRLRPDWRPTTAEKTDKPR